MYLRARAIDSLFLEKKKKKVFFFGKVSLFAKD